MGNPVKDMLRVRRVRRLALHLEVEAAGLENRIAHSATAQGRNATIANELRIVAARIRKAID